MLGRMRMRGVMGVMPPAAFPCGAFVTRQTWGAAASATRRKRRQRWHCLSRHALDDLLP